ncbi:Glycosyltransferase, GT2 family [Flavobacterium fryxellicola]|uniref:Glycosyltransferase 2-like domain-containing protein n=1 Tax=Flavobacterium fryxellicola TaxID=249352 RepID=A0A162KVV9_9FLAO|nr:glycosyltransferase family 2 protein [Flavobacterium fryxellicola]OAB25994.1 hypothetical protein FBFR_13865 [Flavobacterium fryxellicola]SHN69449.1 Glycosyltransferase, GT2 family [Flavobacterium fryxellicola]
MTLNKSVYVIIVTYNPKKWIDKCFNSLRNSTLECKTIVIDNGSTDGSQEIIKKNYPEIDFIQSVENLGFGKANNIGIEKAYSQGADYILLLNQDAWVDDKTIEKLIEALKINPSYGIFSPVHMNGMGSDLDFGFKKALGNINLDIKIDTDEKHIEVKFVNAAIWLLSRKCIEVVGGFSPVFFHYCEDNNYLHRLEYHGFKIGVLRDAEGYHDRADRVENVFYSDLYQIFERDIAMTLSNPILRISYFKILIATFFNLAIDILKNNPDKLKNKIYLRALLNTDKKKILINRNLSKNQFGAFLNLKF